MFLKKTCFAHKKCYFVWVCVCKKMTLKTIEFHKFHFSNSKCKCLNTPILDLWISTAYNIHATLSRAMGYPVLNAKEKKQKLKKKKQFFCFVENPFPCQVPAERLWETGCFSSSSPWCSSWGWRRWRAMSGGSRSWGSRGNGWSCSPPSGHAAWPPAPLRPLRPQRPHCPEDPGFSAQPYPGTRISSAFLSSCWKHLCLKTWNKKVPTYSHFSIICNLPYIVKIINLLHTLKDMKLYVSAMTGA